MLVELAKILGKNRTTAHEIVRRDEDLGQIFNHLHSKMSGKQIKNSRQIICNVCSKGSYIFIPVEQRQKVFENVGDVYIFLKTHSSILKDNTYHAQSKIFDEILLNQTLLPANSSFYSVCRKRRHFWQNLKFCFKKISTRPLDC